MKLPSPLPLSNTKNRIREFLGTRAGNLSIEYVYSPSYKTTNNIYSLWMAREIINYSRKIRFDLS